MPSRNVVREFDTDSLYHVYNRGVNKDLIFKDERDYSVFLSFLKYALLSDEHINKNDLIDKKLLSEAQRFNLRREGLANKVELVSYCLMPNHFHLLLYQYDKEGITKLMRSIATGYVMYFNKRHKRIGSLFQGTYKASRIQSDSYWMHISRYIHLNPADLGDYRDYPYSSYKIFMGKNHAEWVHPEKVLDSFKNRKEYEKFVESYLEQRNDLKEISRLLANSKELEED